MLPLLPTMAIGLGASLATSAFVVATLTIGQLLGSVLGGALVIRVGERRSMVLASVLGAVGGLVGMVAESVGLLVAACVATGVSVSAVALARHAFMTVVVPAGHRGRAMAMVGGSSKLGQLVGPFVMVLLLGLGAPARMSFALVTFASVAVGVLLVTSRSFDDTADPDLERTHGTWQVVRRHKRPLAVIGTGAALLGMLRISRLVLVPLWGVAIDLSDSTIALIVGCASALDFALFYPGGVLLDRFGRVLVAVPALLLYAGSHVGMALVGVAPGGVQLLVTTALVMAVANSLTSGVIGALGSDLADPRNLPEFLSAWRLITETGPALTPVLLAASAVVSLGFASLVMAAVSLVSALLLGRGSATYLPRLGVPDPG